MSGLRDEIAAALVTSQRGPKAWDAFPEDVREVYRIDADYLITHVIGRHIAAAAEKARAEALRSLGADLLAKARGTGDYKWAMAAGQMEQVLAEVPATEALSAEPADAEVEAVSEWLCDDFYGEGSASSWERNTERPYWRGKARRLLAALTAAREVKP